jgi:hypothetical protein
MSDPSDLGGVLTRGPGFGIEPTIGPNPVGAADTGSSGTRCGGPICSGMSEFNLRVPTPGAGALLGCGLCMLGRRQRRA